MRFTDRPKWKRTVLAVICLIGLLAVAGGSFAAYTSQAFQRGVARNRDNETVRFTSNYLQSCASNAAESSYATRIVSFGEDNKNSERLDVELDIYNYVYNYTDGNTNLISQRDITYDLTISFSGGGENGYSISTDAGTVSGSGTKFQVKDLTLTGRTARSHKFNIHFPVSDLDQVKITVTAVPRNLSVTNGQKLAAVISPCVGTATATFSSEGKFVYDTNANPTDYDGFNYEISISSGEATAVLEWNPDVLEIDQLFLSTNNLTPSSGITHSGWKQITMKMDQTKGEGDYLISFYKNTSTIPDTWGEMNSYISFTATQITQ